MTRPKIQAAVLLHETCCYSGPYPLDHMARWPNGQLVTLPAQTRQLGHQMQQLAINSTPHALSMSKLPIQKAVVGTRNSRNGFPGSRRRRAKVGPERRSRGGCGLVFLVGTPFFRWFSRTTKRRSTSSWGALPKTDIRNSWGVPPKSHPYVLQHGGSGLHGA